jgi:ABC-type sugar transport system ATPase subunit
MKIEFINVSSKEGLRNLTLELKLNKVVLLRDPSENLSRAILNAIVGLDEIWEGEIRIDDTGINDFLQKEPQIRSFGYIFDEGIMLSNLSLMET